MSHALTVLSWFELLEDERPPERIWLDDDAIGEHFERVDQARKSGTKYDAVPDADMDQNELTADFKR